MLSRDAIKKIGNYVFSSCVRQTAHFGLLNVTMSAKVLDARQESQGLVASNGRLEFWFTEFGLPFEFNEMLKIRVYECYNFRTLEL